MPPSTGKASHSPSASGGSTARHSRKPSKTIPSSTSESQRSSARPPSSHGRTQNSHDRQRGGGSGGSGSSGGTAHRSRATMDRAPPALMKVVTNPEGMVSSSQYGIGVATTSYHQSGETGITGSRSSQPQQSTSQLQHRPSLKSRAQSSPVVPVGGVNPASLTSQHRDPAVSNSGALPPITHASSFDGEIFNQHDNLEASANVQQLRRKHPFSANNLEKESDESDEEEEGDDAGDDEISKDPFFQRYSRQQFEQEDEDDEEEEGLLMTTSGSSSSARLAEMGRRQQEELLQLQQQQAAQGGPLSPMNPYLLAPQQTTAHDGAVGRSPLGSPHGPLSPQYWNNTSILKPLQEFNIAVLGAPQTGKSTFIQKAFDLPQTPSILFTRRKMSLDGTVYVIRTIELNYQDLDLDDEKCICWPDMLAGTPVPAIDGAFILYDVMNRDSLIQVPEALSGTSNSGIPYLLVACKCDYSPNIRPVDPNTVDEPLRKFFDVKTFQTSESSPDTQKRCMAVMLRQMISKRKHRFEANPNRRRANSTAQTQHAGNHNHLAGPGAGLQKHNRAISEITLMNHYRGNGGGGSIRARRKAASTDQNSPISNRSKSHQQLAMLNHSGTTLFEAEQTVQESTEDGEVNAESKATALKSPKSAGNMQQLLAESAVTFDELVTRLVSKPMSKTDTKFQTVFLALYRYFASPGQLLDAIIDRFDAAGREGVTQILILNNQQRHLAIINDWVSVYPGDFAHPFTRVKLQGLISKLAGVRIFQAAAQELAVNLEHAGEDDDTEWAVSDASLAAKTIGTKNAATRSLLAKSMAGLAVTVDLPHYTPNQNSINSPLASPTSGGSAGGMGNLMSSTQSLLNLVEHATKQATTFAPSGKYPLTKVQWRQFMSLSDEAVARELTRMDWIMFLSIRPRDLMRHVTMTEAQKSGINGSSSSSASSNKGNSNTSGTSSSIHLENVQRIIDHFNHIASWAANLILYRDKPKHRAMMLEKLMRIARELRKLNNYNALGALIAGINSASIQRLHSTKELIDPVIGRDFMKLEILMSPQRSHSAYRLAWENSSGERIPYLPLHRRDLVTAEAGNKTFVDDDGETSNVGDINEQRINWKKFEIMGDVVVGMQKAKETPYQAVARNEEVAKLLVELAVERDDDKLYERSQQLESAAGGSKQRRFAWLP